MPHRVLLSSTFTDLAEYRRSVQDAIRQLGAIDVSMEHFGANDERPAAECVRPVREESDLCVGIYAHRYGYIPDGEDVSVSELEYRAASATGLPRFIYLVDETQPWVPNHIDAGDNAAKLRSFKEHLMKQHVCKQFGNRDQLATRVVADPGRQIAMHNAPKVGPGIPVPDIGLESLRGPVEKTVDAWNERRNSIYGRNRGIFLTHVIRPSAKPDQEFDVLVYLLRHKSDDLSDARVAEFLMGPYWENKVFPAIEEHGFTGIATSAYGTFLCVCRIPFNDGTRICLDRYIDFEANRAGGPT